MLYRSRFALAVIVATLGSTLHAQDDRPRYVTYRLMAYNVASAAGVPLGPRQIGQIADTIIDNAVDVAGLTEIELGTGWHDGRDHMAELCVALADRGYPMHLYKWPAVPMQGGWQTPALLSRFAITETGFDVVLPPEGNRWCVGHVTFDVAENTPVRASMTHFWPIGPAEPRNAAVRKLVSIPIAFDGPATVMGDFNLTPNGDLYPIVLEAGWRNGCEVVHGTPCPSVQGQAGISGPLPLTGQIDYVFGNDRIEFLDSYVGYFSMADHWPVFAEVRVKTNGPALRPSLPDTSANQSDTSRARAEAARHYRAHDYAAAADAYLAWERVCGKRDDAGFAAYSDGCMRLLEGNEKSAHGTFERVITEYPDSEWSARAAYRRAFLFKQAGESKQAAEAFVAYLDGYYAQIHPDVKAPAIWITAREIAVCRSTPDQRVTRMDVLRQLASRRPESMTARASAYRLAREAYDHGNTDEAIRYLQQARPSPHAAWPNEARPVAELYLAAGDRERADAFYEQFLRGINNPLHRRVRVARWVRQTEPESLKFNVPVVKGIRIDGDLDDWSVEPLVVLEGEPHLYVIDPAAAVSELHAEVRVGRTGDALVLALDVTDDRAYCPHSAREMYRGDSVQIAIDPAADATPGYDQNDIEFGVALAQGDVKTFLWRNEQKRDLSGIEAVVARDEGHTRYEIAIPAVALAPDGNLPARIGLNLLINDADDGPRHAWLDWTPGIGEEKSPYLFPTLILAP